MFRRFLAVFAVFALVAVAAVPDRAHAQYGAAAAIGRANQAMEICNSPLGAGVPECAQLKGLMGQGTATTLNTQQSQGLAQCLSVTGGNQAAVGACNTKFGVNGAAAGSALMAGAAAQPGGLNQAYAQCVARMAGNQMGLNACSALITAQQSLAAAPAQTYVPPVAPQGYNPPAPGYPGAPPLQPAPQKAPYDPLGF